MMTTAKSLDERHRISEASARLLAEAAQNQGTPPNVSDLARAAGVKRWVIVQKHTDLKEHFQKEVAGLQNVGDARSRSSRLETAEREVANLKSDNIALRRRVEFYANALNELSVAYEECKQNLAARKGGKIVDFPHGDK
jgi:hypothetical protein